jgi:very-short-patch-repair endonuclease
VAGKDASIFELAGRQHGIVSASQLHALGLSDDRIAWRVRQGWLGRVHRGVYAVGHPPLTWPARWMAAVLACGPGAVLSHASAAALWELGPAPGSPIAVTVAGHGGRGARPGLVVHRSQRFDPVVRDGIPVTTPARTLVDLAPLVSRRRLERAADEAERLCLCDARDLEAILASEPCRPGTGALRRLLAAHALGSTLTRSALEERFLGLCRRQGLPPPLVNAPVLDYTVDFLWPDSALVVEVDGYASHGTRRAFQEDRVRDARLTAAGLRTLRFTHRDVVRAPAVVASRVRSARRHRLADAGG